MARKPAIKKGPASSYASGNEAIMEISTPSGKGGLISVWQHDDGTVTVSLYRLDPGIAVRVQEGTEVLQGAVRFGQPTPQAGDDGDDGDDEAEAPWVCCDKDSGKFMTLNADGSHQTVEFWAEDVEDAHQFSGWIPAKMAADQYDGYVFSLSLSEARSR